MQWEEARVLLARCYLRVKGPDPHVHGPSVRPPMFTSTRVQNPPHVCARASSTPASLLAPRAQANLPYWEWDLCDVALWGRQLLQGPGPSPGGGGSYAEQPFPTGYPSFPPSGMHKRVASYEPDLAGAMSSPAMVQCPGAAPDLLTAVRIKKTSSGPWVQAVQLVSCGSNATVNSGLNDGGVTGWEVDDACASGYDQLRGYERNSTSDPLWGVWGLSFHCSGSGVWTTPVGSGPGGYTGRLVTLQCPRDWRMSGLVLWGNTSQVGVVAPFCTPASGVPYDPLATCPFIKGGTLLPGYVSPNPITADLGTSIAANTAVSTVISMCQATASCAAAVLSPTGAGASGDNYNAVLTVSAGLAVAGGVGADVGVSVDVGMGVGVDAAEACKARRRMSAVGRLGAACKRCAAATTNDEPLLSSWTRWIDVPALYCVRNASALAPRTCRCPTCNPPATWTDSRAAPAPSCSTPKVTHHRAEHGSNNRTEQPRAHSSNKFVVFSQKLRPTDRIPTMPYV